MRYYEPPQFDVKSLFVPDMTPWEQMIRMKEYEFAAGKDMADKQQKKVDEAGAKIEDAFNKVIRTGGAMTSDYARNVINPAIESERQKAHMQLEANPNAANGILFNAISNIKNITNSKGYQNTLLDETYLPEAYKSSIKARNTPMVHQTYLDENGQFKQLDKAQIENTIWNPSLYDTYEGQPIQKEFGWIPSLLKNEIRKEYGDVDIQTLNNAQGIPTTYIVKSGGEKISELTRPMIEQKIKPYIETYTLGNDSYTGYKLRTVSNYGKENLIKELGDYLSLGTYKHKEDIPDEYKAIPQGKSSRTGNGPDVTTPGVPNVLGSAMDLIQNSPAPKTTVDAVSAASMAGVSSYDPKTNTGEADLSNSKVIYNYNPTTKTAIEKSQDVALKSKIADNYVQTVANDDRIKALMSSALGKEYIVETSDDGKGLVKIFIGEKETNREFGSIVNKEPITTTEVFNFVNGLLAKPGASKLYPELAQLRLTALTNGIDLSNTKDLDTLNKWKKENPGTALISKAFEEGTFNGNYKVSIPNTDNTVKDNQGNIYVNASIEIPAEQIEQVMFPDNRGPGYNYEDLIEEGHVKEKFDKEGNKFYVANILIPSKTDINSATISAQSLTFGSDQMSKESIIPYQADNNNKATNIKADNLIKNIQKNYSLFKPEDKATLYATAKKPEIQAIYTNSNFNYPAFVDAAMKSTDPSDFAYLVLSINNPQGFLNIINQKHEQKTSSSGGGANNMGKPQVGVKVR